jgi:hypothetical protein
MSAPGHCFEDLALKKLAFARCRCPRAPAVSPEPVTTPVARDLGSGNQSHPRGGGLASVPDRLAPLIRFGKKVYLFQSINYEPSI